MWVRSFAFAGLSWSICLIGCSTPQAKQQAEIISTEPPPAMVEKVPAPEKAEEIELAQFTAAEDEKVELLEEPSELLPGPNPALRWHEHADYDSGACESYSLEMLLGLAMGNNPTLRQARLQISATLAQAQQAGLYPNPTLAYLGENINSGGTPGEFQGMELEQRFVTADKLQLSRNKYLQRAKVAEHLAVMQQFKVCNDVKLHYIATLEAQMQLELEKEMLKTFEDRLVTAKELYNLGQANEVDVRRTLADLRRQQLDVLQAENRVRRMFLELTSVVGVELVYRPLDGRLEPPRDIIEFEQAYARILSESPEILAAYSKLKEDHITVHRELVEWVPDIVIAGGSGYNFESEDAVANVRVQIEVPLYDRNQGTIRQARDDEQRQRSEIRRTELTLRQNLATEYERYFTALQRVENYQTTVLPEMRAAYEQALQSYREDRQDWPDVLDTHSEYTTRRLEYVQDLKELRSAEVLITGFLLRNGLEAAPNPTPPGHIDSTPNPR